MSKGRTIQCFDYVNHPYQRVRDLLTADAVPVFSRATKGASARADDLASELHVNVGAIDVGTDIEIAVHRIEDTRGVGKMSAGMRILFEWKARKSSRLFPLMRAELHVFPLTSTETQLAFTGRYDPPLGVVGKGLDAIMGNRIADASIHRFVGEVAQHLRTTLK